VGILPAGSGVPPERTSKSGNASTTVGKTAPQDASLGGRDAHPTRDDPLGSLFLNDDLLSGTELRTSEAKGFATAS